MMRNIQSSYRKKMDFTIVTVTYNAENSIAETVETVFNQEVNFDYEYLLLDGESKDNTVQIFNEIASKYHNEHVHYSISIEKDDGIYDAMNKGIQKASGQYIIFMNSGDVFYHNHVLQNVHDVVNTDYENLPDVLYGSVAITQKGKETVVHPQPLSRMRIEMPFCHQSVFVKTSCAKKSLYDTKYKVCADYDFFHKLYLQGKSFKQLDEIVSKYDLNGFTNQNRETWYNDMNQIIQHYASLKKIPLTLLLRLKYLNVRKKIKKIIVGHY